MSHLSERQGMTEELIYSPWRNARSFDRDIFGILMNFTECGEEGAAVDVAGD